MLFLKAIGGSGDFIGEAGAMAGRVMHSGAAVTGRSANKKAVCHITEYALLCRQVTVLSVDTAQQEPLGIH
jgi:hypothetical protein